MWKKRFILFAWTLLGIATVALLIAAMGVKNHKTCSGINLILEGGKEEVFLNEKTLLKIINRNGAIKGRDIASIDVNNIEALLEQNAWVKNAELFFDNNQVLQIRITEREPLARIFTMQGNSFYIDSSATILPLSDDLSARVPVFTSFPSDKHKLSIPDSLLMDEVKKIALFIQPDSFWMSLVSQIDISPQGTFQLIPLLGNQVIELGDADSLQPKFDRLFSFYKQVWAKAGFEKYEKIDVQFSGQVVATKRGAQRAFTDSVKAMQQLRNSLENMNAGMVENAVPEIKENIVKKTEKTMPQNAKQVKKNIPLKKHKPKAVMKKKGAN